MLKNLEHLFSQWKAGANIPDWLVPIQVIDLLYFFIFVAVLFMIYKLARSEEVSESGEVRVKYHSPLTWPSRYAERIATERANYSPKQRNLMSVLHRGKNFLQGLLALMLGLVLFGMGAFLVYVEPQSIFEKSTVAFIIIGLLVIAYSCWIFSTIKSDDPFK